VRIESKPQQEVISVGAELATVQSLQAITPVEFFKPNGSDPLISAMKEEVRKRAESLDISTAAKRKQLASLARQIGSAKNRIDEKRKELVADTKKSLREIDAEGLRIWNDLEDFQEEIRQPLTEWENAEKERIAGHESAISHIHTIAMLTSELDCIPAVIEAKISEILIISRRNFEEFSKPAQVAIDQALGSLQSALAREKEAIAQREELERLRREETERKAREREEAIARQAKEEAERKARDREEELRRQAEDERLRIEEERFLAEARAKQAEAERIAAEERAARELADAERRREEERLRLEQEKQEALRQAEERRIQEEKAAKERAAEARKKAEEEMQEAIEAERLRVAQEKLKEAREADARARNRANQAKVNREALAAMVEVGIPEEFGKKLIEAIVKKQIPHISIAY